MNYTFKWTGQREVGFEVFFARKVKEIVKSKLSRLVNKNERHAHPA
jgi:hypothetical protein